MDARRSPKRILDANPPDQRPQVRLDQRSPSPWPRLPTPVEAEAGPVPANKGLGLDHGQHGEDRREPVIKLHEEPAIAVSQRDATFDLASQHKNLLPQQLILSDEITLRPERRGQDGQQERNQSNQRPTIDDSIRLIRPNEVFGTHRDT